MDLVNLLGIYINTDQIIKVSDNGPGRSRITFSTGDQLDLRLAPEEIVALIESTNTPLKSSVDSLIEINQNNQMLINKANLYIQELTDKLKLLNSEYMSLKESVKG